MNTLRELVERSYLKQVHGNANYNIKYEKETKDGNEATVTGVLQHDGARQEGEDRPRVQDVVEG